MEFGITQESNLEGEKNILVIKLSNELNTYFLNKEYGSSIHHFLIGIICVKPEFDFFFKVRSPKYKSIDKIKHINGSIAEYSGVYEYDIKLNFNEIISVNERECKKILAKEILNSLSNLEALPKKVKDFDKERFKTDMEHFFKSEELI